MRILSILSILLILCGCGNGRETDRSAIAVSFEPQAWMLRQIAGNDFEIVTLLPPGSDPETYQPSVSTMRRLGDSKAFFTLGTPGFEKSLTDNVSINFPGLEIIDCTQGIEKITGTHRHSSGHRKDESGHDDEESFDPHIFSSPRNCLAVTEIMTDFLTELRPEKAKEYKESGDKLKARLKVLDDSLSNMNLNGRSFVIRHPSLSYLCRDYGLTQIALQDDGKETSPMQMKQKIDEIKNRRPALFIVENEHANAADGETATLLGVDTVHLSLNSSGWLDDLMRLAHEINRN